MMVMVMVIVMMDGDDVGSSAFLRPPPLTV
jgi:hypothetical protein